MPLARPPLSDVFAPLYERFRALERPNDVLRRFGDALARADSWRWATENMFEAALLPHQMEKRPAPRWHKEGKTPGGYAVEHALDAAGGILLWTHDRPGDLEGRQVNVIERDPEGRWVEVHWLERLYERKRRLWRIERYDLDERGRPTDLWLMTCNTTTALVAYHHAYIYEGERLARCEYLEREDWFDEGYRSSNDPKNAEPRWKDKSRDDGDRAWDEFAYDDEGLDTITSVYESAEKSSRSLQYRRPRKGETPKDLAPGIVDLLVEGAVRAITERPPAGPVFAVALAQSDHDFDLPPTLFVCPASHRDRMTTEHGKGAKEELWVAEQWPGDPVELGDDERYALFNMVCEPKKATGTKRKALREAAARLWAHDWSGVMETTDDFVVTPYDIHGETGVRSHVKASVDDERFALLKDRGLI